MNEREYIAALERDLKAALTRAEAAEQRIEHLRQAICAVAASTNKVQRIIAGEQE